MLVLVLVLVSISVGGISVGDVVMLLCGLNLFNVGKYRRDVSISGNNAKANFFSSTNKQAATQRQQAAALALQDLLLWLDGNNDEKEEEDTTNDTNKESMNNENKNLTSLFQKMMISRGKRRRGPDRIAIYDATNSTNQRRNWILQECQNHSLHNTNNKSPIGVIFVESLCDDIELLRENYLFKVRSSPD